MADQGARPAAAAPSGEAGSAQAQPFTPPAVSLPKGGGAIRGIGETFSANPVTGTGSMTVPLATSPGRSGFGPQLALSYDSGAGNGLFGFGWGLALPSITRRTDRGLPRYLDDGHDCDVFVLSGAEDLVPVLLDRGAVWEPNRETRTLSDGSHWHVRRYRPRTEGLFARIERWTDARTLQTHWRSISRENVTTLYGSTEESRIADPADAQRVFSWLISESCDDKGNAIVYRYKGEDSTGVDTAQAHERNRSQRSRSAQRHIKRIQYGNRTPRADGEDLRARTDWLFEIVFDYGEHDAKRPRPGDGGDWLCRHDPFSTCRAGFDLRTYRLCQRVLMFHHFAEEPDVGRDCLVRSTRFAYRSIRGIDADVRRGHPLASFVASMTQSGHRRLDGGGYLTSSLPPLEFEYSEARIQDVLEEVDAESVENLPSGVDGRLYGWADLDGVGLQGVVTQQGDAWYYKRNLSADDAGHDRAARFAPLDVMARAPSTGVLGRGGQLLLDLGGDGTLDLVELEGPVPGFHERTEDGAWSSFMPFESLPNVDWSDPNLRFADLTGDGRADVLITEDDVLVWHPSLGEGGFDRARRVAQSLDEEAGPRLVFADGTDSIHLADSCGDGLPDLIRIRNGEIACWHNLGYGRFGPKVTMDNAPWFDAPERFDPSRIRLGDVDGTGTVDVFYLREDGVQLYLNQSGNSWSDVHTLTSLPVEYDLASIAVTDLLGNGTACLVSSSPLPADTARPMRYIDLMGGVKPHLLIGVRNNLGAETRVRYAPSTKFSLQDERAGRPWLTRLPFPVHVVERVETLDRVSRNRFVTRYAYSHGRFDGRSREFCGFGLIRQVDTEELAALTTGGELEAGANADARSHVPPVLTKTWYHTGALLESGRLSGHYAAEYYREPGLTEAQLWALLLDDTPLPRSILAADGSRRPYRLSDVELEEACRALRGSMLRQEVYALDGSEAEDRPYSVTESNQTVELLQPKAGNPHAVFYAHDRETVSYTYERALIDVGGVRVADPRVGHALTLEVDGFGNVLRSAAVSYGRRHPDGDLSNADRTRQARTLITYAENRVTNAVDDEDDHRNPLPCESRTFELTGLALPAGRPRYTLDEIRKAGPGAAVIPYERELTAGRREKRLIEHMRTLYRRDDLTGLLPLGRVESLALPYESYRLAFTPGLITAVYGARVSRAMLEDACRYVHSEGDQNWWIPSGRVFYSPDRADTATRELANARAHFFLGRRYSDPFDTDAVPTESLVTYDRYDLLVEEVQDALGNRVTVGERDVDPRRPIVRRGHDYRVLQPALLMDANRNRSAVAFDALGVVVGTAVMGAPELNPVPGDRLDASFPADVARADIDAFLADTTGPVAATLLGEATTRIVYDPNAYWRAPVGGSRPPAFVATLARETHASEPTSAGGPRVQTRFSYSDGFGREIQRKLQAEPGPVPRRDASGDVMVGADGRPQMTSDVGPRWIGSGWTVFNNKGRQVREYEPFFTDRHSFEFDVRIGVSPVLLYDPVQRVVATLHPNHTWQKVVFHPWRHVTWEVSDTVLVDDPKTDPDVGELVARLPDGEYLPSWHAQRRDGALGAQERAAADKAAVHAATPALAHVDPLSRIFLTVARNSFKYSDAPPADPATKEEYLTRFGFDIEGNEREIVDANGRVVMRYAYDILGNRIHQASMETGRRWTLGDVAGRPAYAWNDRGHVFRTEYDRLHRPIRTFVLGADPTRPTAELLTERLLYGEQHPNAEPRGLRGKLHLHLDQAGLLRHEAHDFKGNLVHTSRRIASEYRRAIDWSAIDAALPADATATFDPAALEATLAGGLEEDVFVTRTRHDALNRPSELTAPDGTVIRLGYNEANLLGRIDANLRGVQRSGQPVWTPFVTRIDYDAKAQRTLIAYGSGAKRDRQGVTTTYRYDPLTFRLVGLVTRRDPAAFPGDCPRSPPSGFRGGQVQSLQYTYDPAGNVTQIRDNAQQTVFFRNRSVDPSNDFTYDALSRLIEGTGREHLGQAGGSPIPHSYSDRPQVGLPHPGDGNALGRYIERYTYDSVGNITLLRHIAADARSSGWRRVFTYGEASQLEPTRSSNRLTRTTVGAITETYSAGGDGYDAHGSMLRMPHLPVMHWDFRDQLRMTQRQVVNGAAGDAGERTWYVYDGAGQRVRKVVEGGAGHVREERVYLVGFEVYRRPGPDPIVCETQHIMDGAKRIALVETRMEGEQNLPAQLIRYQLSNHLGSCSLELDQRARIISYEEYNPYGGTSYQAVKRQTETPKRYRYTGKERDEESGFYYHGARYYAAWLARWTSADPNATRDGPNVYAYCEDNPVVLVDENGEQTNKAWAVSPEFAEDIATLHLILDPAYADWPKAYSFPGSGEPTPIFDAPLTMVARPVNNGGAFFLLGHYSFLTAYDLFSISKQEVYVDNGDATVTVLNRPQISYQGRIVPLVRDAPSSEQLQFSAELLVLFFPFGEAGGAARGLASAAKGAAVGTELTIPGVHGSLLAEAQVAVASTIEEQAAWLSRLVPGLEERQALRILERAFDKESPVVFGGSRIRGNYGVASDLDVGFSRLTPNQAAKFAAKETKLGPLSLESTTRIVTGNVTDNIPRILSPEEFFQRVGVRAAQDLKAGQVFLPSGSITALSNRVLIYIPPGIRP